MNDDVVLKNLGMVRPAPNTTAARRSVPWAEMSNEDLKFALDLLMLHRSPYESDVLLVIQQRIERGEWLDLEKPPPPLHNVPRWLQMWPFRLLWKQRD